MACNAGPYMIKQSNAVSRSRTSISATSSLLSSLSSRSLLSAGSATDSQSPPCTRPQHVIPMDPSDPQAGITLNGFYLTNDTWNAAGYNISQTMSVCDYNNWYVTATIDTGTAVKSYPNVHRDFPHKPLISSFKKIVSSFAQSGPHTGIYEYAYDIWLNGVASSGSTEMMIWTDNFGQIPSGSKQGIFTDGDQTYTVWKTPGNYIAFVANKNVTSGMINMLHFYDYLIAKGWIPSNSTIGQIGYGIELVSTDNVPAVFKVTGFSLVAD